MFWKDRMEKSKSWFRRTSGTKGFEARQFGLVSRDELVRPDALKIFRSEEKKRRPERKGKKGFRKEKKNKTRLPPKGIGRIAGETKE